MKEIKELPKEIFSGAILSRRIIHQNPELSNEEAKTAKFIASCLKNYGVEFQTEIGGHGIVATIKGKNPNSRCIALRADMDALRIKEVNDGRLYRSQNEGVMHACGHDVHTSILLGAVQSLKLLKNNFSGTIKFIFQPAEEINPSGAPRMIEAGVLENVSSIFGLHVSPEMEVGTVGLFKGPFMASSDEIHITVIGKGGHAARPAEIVSPLIIGSEIVLKLSTNKSNDENPILLQFGKLTAEGSANTIPNTSELVGTLRCFDENIRKFQKKYIQEEASKIAYKHNGSVELNFLEGAPVVMNDIFLTQKLELSALKFFGKNAIVDIPRRMGAEDFAFYSHQIPACFARLGSGNKQKGITASLHNESFDVDEDCIKIGIELMCVFAFSQLS